MDLIIRFTRIFVITCAMFLSVSGVRLDCFICHNATSPSVCHNVTSCAEHERCSTIAIRDQNSSLPLYKLGCSSASACLSANNVSVSQDLVGRRSVDSTLCHQCCGVHGCNKNLCSHIKTTVVSRNDSCEDDPTFDCKTVSSVFNICSDVSHSKTVCRKWCGLCDLVDGNWASWTSWSGCSVTCEKGTQSRSRTCTDPAPVNGGEDCAGSANEYRPCELDLCPVHGAWSPWSNWTDCSATCGIGVTKRHRACDNPKPQRFGQHCFGDSVDFNVCQVSQCIVTRIDGGWAAWSRWGLCSGTCGIGLKIRERNCSEPEPANGGHECHGDYHGYELCKHERVCPVEEKGIWSGWSEWHPCAVNYMFRNRTCTPLSPQSTHPKCNGTGFEYTICGGSTTDLTPSNNVSISSSVL